METAKIFDFKNGEELNIKVLEGGKKVKLTKEGKIKQTPNNNKADRLVMPIKKVEDVERCKEFLKKRVEEAPPKYKKSYAKDLLLFKIGINVGMRVNDLLSIEWKDIFKPGTKQFNEYFVPKEQKTQKVRQIFINKSFRAAVKEYLKYIPDTDTSQGYVFTNRQGNRLSDASVDKMLKLLEKELNLENLSTHSLRKTFAYHLYMQTNDLSLVQEILQHSSVAVTRRYLGLTQEVKKKAYNDLNL